MCGTEPVVSEVYESFDYVNTVARQLIWLSSQGPSDSRYFCIQLWKYRQSSQQLSYFPLFPAFRCTSIFALISARETGLDCNIRRKILSNLFSAVVLTLIAPC